MPTSTNKTLLVLTLLLAVFLRLVNLGSFPSLNPDEAALGYNAYSLLQTGRDEHGQSWPIHFKSFGDYKPGGYVYLAIPFIKILGLTPLSIRLPNFLLSILAIYSVYLLTKLLTRNNLLALITTFTLTISPWHIHFSRGAWETSSALTFILFGILFFYYYLEKKQNYFIYFSSFSFISSFYIYHSARLVGPLIILYLFFSNYKVLTKKFSSLIVPILISILFLLPVTSSFLKNNGTARFSGVGLGADQGPLSRAEELINQHGNNHLYTRIVHNRRILLGLSWFQKYLSHFDLNFLFINGDEVPRSKSPDMGQLYLFELPLIILGVMFLLKNNQYSRFSHLIISLFIVCPIASSLTFQAPSALRSLPLVIPFTLTTACGTYYFLQLTKKLFPHNLFLITILIVYSLYYYLDSYFVHAPQRYPFAWNNSFPSAIQFIQNYQSTYSHIYFTNKYDQPYILYLFYTKYPPLKIQDQIKLTSPDKFGFSTVNQIDNIQFFIPKNWSEIPDNSLIIASDEITDKLPIKIINFPNGLPGFKIFQK